MMKKLHLFLIIAILSLQYTFAQYAKLNATTELDHDTYNDIETRVHNDTGNDITADYQAQIELNEKIWDQSLLTRSLNPTFTISTIDASTITVNGSPLIVTGDMTQTSINWVNWVKGQVDTVAGETGCADCDVNVGHVFQMSESFGANNENTFDVPDGSGNRWHTSAHGIEVITNPDQEFILGHGINGHGLNIENDHREGKIINIEVDFWDDGSYTNRQAETLMGPGGTADYKAPVFTDITTNCALNESGYIYFTLTTATGSMYPARCLVADLVNAGNESAVKITQHLADYPQQIKKYSVPSNDLPHTPSISFSGNNLSVTGDNYNVVRNGIAVDYVYYIREKANTATWETLNPKAGHKLSEVLDVTTQGLTASDFTDAGTHEVVVYMIDGNALSTGGTTLSIANNTIAGFKMFPNPTKNTLNFQATEKLNSIIITDMQGRIIIEKSFNDYNTSIDLSNIEKGIYFANIYDANNKLRKTEKVIKE